MHVFLRLENKNEIICKITLKKQTNKTTIVEKRLLKALLQSHSFVIESSGILAVGQITREGAADMFGIIWHIIHHSG